MNILHLTTYLQGGAGKLITDLLVYQKKAGHEVFLITSDTEYPGYCNYSEYFQTLKDTDISYSKIDSLFKRDLLLNLVASEKVSQLLTRHNIDIIHTHAAIPSFISLISRSAIKRNIPIIQTMHGWGNNKSQEHEAQDRIIMQNIDQVIVVSKDSRSFLETKNIDTKLIYNGIKEKIPDKIRIPSALEQYFTQSKKNNKKIIGCFGSICERKNQKLLIEAMKELVKTRKDLSCLFIGEEDSSYPMRKLVAKYQLQDFIYFSDYQKNADYYMPFLNVLCLPSLSEGHSLCLLEGFREKIPVIASDIPAFSEIISNNNGFIFESNNALSLSQCILNVLELNVNQKKEILLQAYNDYHNKFNFEKMAKKYEHIYSTL